ncbi:MAG: hypothetical protein ACREGH_03240 [Minisyncoccia bacterium]
MTASGKWIIAIIVLIVIVGGLYYWYIARPAGESSPINTSESTTTESGTTSTTTGAQNESATLPSGDSNTALQQSATQIDTQMSSFNSDDASINSGLNDQPVEQSSL